MRESSNPEPQNKKKKKSYEKPKITSFGTVDKITGMITPDLGADMGGRVS